MHTCINTTNIGTINLHTSIIFYIHKNYELLAKDIIKSDENYSLESISHKIVKKLASYFKSNIKGMQVLSPKVLRHPITVI